MKIYKKLNTTDRPYCNGCGVTEGDITDFLQHDSVNNMPIVTLCADCQLDMGKCITEGKAEPLPLTLITMLVERIPKP